MEKMRDMFPEAIDEKFREKFIHMVVHGRNSSTYKFAFARFLVEYCNNEEASQHVEFSTVGSYFLKFYWPQICKTKLKHSPKYIQKNGIEKTVEIVSIIEKEFTESWYPKPFTYYEENDDLKIKNCIDEIVGENGCLNDVVWRFQKINNKETNDCFKYKVKSGWSDPNKKKTDLTFGINLDLDFMKFIKLNYFLLRSFVIFEWARFLERFNRNVPLIIPKLEGSEIKRNTTYANKAKLELEKFHKKCFYCTKDLISDNTHLEHVIPFDYIADDNMWNYALACQKCNCKKLGSLPPEEFLDKLVSNIVEDRKKIPMLDESLEIIGDDFKDHIRNHYSNAKKFGYIPKPMP
jgi:5-methylcytosine-specific restriction endonuclease McrA